MDISLESPGLTTGAFFVSVYRRVRTGGRAALMRINIWVVLIVLIALLAVTRVLRYQQDTQRSALSPLSAAACDITHQ
jgi:hypothetical protein